VFPSDLNQRSLAQSDLVPELVSKRYTKVPRQSVTQQRLVQAFGERFSFLEEIQKNINFQCVFFSGHDYVQQEKKRRNPKFQNFENTKLVGKWTRV
jgi:hypothetical protein